MHPGFVFQIDVNQIKIEYEKFHFKAILKAVRIAIKLSKYRKTIFYFDYCNGNIATMLHYINVPCIYILLWQQTKMVLPILEIVNGIFTIAPSKRQTTNGRAATTLGR